MSHPADLSDDALLAECDVLKTRRGGPGGQHRNKVETAIVLTHRPTGMRAEASERRSQLQNKTEAIFRLRLKLAIQVRTPGVAAPSERWAVRVRGGRLSINAGHADFPSLLAEAMNHLAEKDWEPGAAANRLGITVSQMVKLLQKEPAALVYVNAQRAASRRHALR